MDEDCATAERGGPSEEAQAPHNGRPLLKHMYRDFPRDFRQSL